MLLLGNCLDELKKLNDCSVDAVVTDPPYGLNFMGKKWDYDVPSTDIWCEVLRVLKPGGHLLSFFGTRTYHRGVVRIEDAGFEIRDQIQWIYGSGFPKSMDVSKAIDKQAGAEREVIGKKTTYREPQSPNGWDCTKRAKFETAPSTDAAKEWNGWGTALKPANEPIVLARKPLSEKTVADNVLKWGCGAINVDASRIESGSDYHELKVVQGGGHGNKANSFAPGKESIKNRNTIFKPAQGRWPANVMFDEQAAFMLDEQSGILKSGELKGYTRKESKNTCMSGKNYETTFEKSTASIGGASRFFYCAKASKSERNAGLEGMPEKAASNLPMRSKNGIRGGKGIDKTETDRLTKNQNNHPTVKPIKLMEYLIKLITPPNGIVLDPFMGSGSTGVAANNLGFNFIGIELNEEYFEIAKKRIENG